MIRMEKRNDLDKKYTNELKLKKEEVGDREEK